MRALVRAFEYVGDYFILLSKEVEDVVVDKINSTLMAYGDGLEFTKELPVEGGGGGLFIFLI